MRIADLNQDPYIRALIYGDSGSGKTTFVGTAQECEQSSPLIVLNARGQPISLRTVEPRPLVLEVENIKDFNVVYDWLYHQQNMVRLHKYDPSLHQVMKDYLDSVGAMKFKTVAIDSITQVQRLALDVIVGGTMPANPADVPTQTQIQHWGRTLALMTNFTDKWFKLPMNVIMTALTRHHEIEAFGYTLFQPFLWGQSNLEVPSHAEIVGRLVPTEATPVRMRKAISEAASKARADVPFNVLLLKGGRDYIAKWQGAPNPPSMMPEPTMSKMLKVLTTQTGKA